jgi:hypothetical protein
MIKFQDVKRPAYDLYRTETYDPAAKIPWSNKLTALTGFFQENIKISPMDYKPFKDEASWIRFNASYHH